MLPWTVSRDTSSGVWEGARRHLLQPDPLSRSSRTPVRSTRFQLRAYFGLTWVCADTITNFCTVIGILRSGCTAFPISTRNTAAAVADMLSRTGATHLLVSPDAVVGRIANEALKSLADLSMHVNRLAMPVFEDLFPTNVDPTSPFEADVEFPESYDMEAPAVIMHSSGEYILFSCVASLDLTVDDMGTLGSTGHPKPISWTHSGILHWGKAPRTHTHVLVPQIAVDIIWFPVRSKNDIKGAIMGWHGVPMFHGMGLSMCWAAVRTVYTQQSSWCRD